MVITAGDAGGREGSGGGGGGGGAHVLVDVDRCAAAAAEAEVTADLDQQQQQQQAVSGSACCRICHLGDGELPAGSGSGQLVMRLGCGCRGEIAAAHRRCAEAWFSVKGNRRCEICGENAANITGWGGGGKEFMQQWHKTAGIDEEGSSEADGFCRIQTFCNLLIACLVIVFILPWFFHNHMI